MGFTPLGSRREDSSDRCVAKRQRDEGNAERASKVLRTKKVGRGRGLSQTAFKPEAFPIIKRRVGKGKAVEKGGSCMVFHWIKKGRHIRWHEMKLKEHCGK